MKKYFWIICLAGGLYFLFACYYFKLDGKEFDSSSIIGLKIDGVESSFFPSKDSGYVIDSIICDKGANGGWDYKNWTLKVRNITESRTKCQVNFISKYYEPILNGTDPVLKDGLIPVMIDSDGIVKKASLGWEWYQYGDTNNPRWANAVILHDESEVYYDGDIIPEGAIESYFVWIPRYRYQIFNEGNYTSMASSVTNIAKEIKIEFENKDTIKSTGSTVGSWLTHPAFTAFDANGMWVGKFETGYKEAETKDQALVNEALSEKVQIKPDVYSWRGINVANAYLSSYNYQREYNSHMMKNTEWGAVAYLSHSQYGSHDSVRINNHSEYKTGYAGVHEPSCGANGTNGECNEYGTSENVTRLWNTESGVLASTTKNMSGIYDMSGGSWEFVMGVMANDKGIPCSGRDASSNSGFDGPFCEVTGTKTDGIPLPNETYYNTYAYSLVDENYNRRILGDATGEMGPFAIKKYGSRSRQIGSWYEDQSWFVLPVRPWFIRSGSFEHGTEAGIFSFNNVNGSADSTVGFRIVLAF